MEYREIRSFSSDSLDLVSWSLRFWFVRIIESIGYMWLLRDFEMSVLGNKDLFFLFSFFFIDAGYVCFFCAWEEKVHRLMPVLDIAWLPSW